MKSIFLLILVFSACSKNTESYAHFKILSPVNPKNERWHEITNIPTFNVNEHSDGCSGGMSLIYSKLTILHKKHGKTLDWRKCCEVHDKAYYYGGTKNMKKQADTRLSQCVTKVVGNEFLGKAMQAAVEIGSGPNLPTPYRWGYGADFRE